MTIGDAFKEARLHCQLNAAQASRQAGVTHNSLDRLESNRGFTHFRVMEELARVYGIPLWKIVRFAELGKKGVPR